MVTERVGSVNSEGMLRALNELWQRVGGAATKTSLTTSSNRACATTHRGDRAGSSAGVVPHDLRAAVQTDVALADGQPLIVDLSAVTFFGSYGLAALLDPTRTGDTPRSLLRIVVNSDQPAIWPIELIGLDEVVVLHSTLEEAMTATDDPGGAHRINPGAQLLVLLTGYARRLIHFRLNCGMRKEGARG